MDSRCDYIENIWPGAAGRCNRERGLMPKPGSTDSFPEPQERQTKTDPTRLSFVLQMCLWGMHPMHIYLAIIKHVINKKKINKKSI